jgi:leader peptidase (prepilin peptidase) / N-methyltransferase
MNDYPHPLSDFILWLAFVVGLAVGSFLNVVAFRLLAMGEQEEQALEGHGLESSEGDSSEGQDQEEQAFEFKWQFPNLITYSQEWAAHILEVLQLVSSPPSHCPQCKTQIKPYDNIPVLSYVLLGGQCRQCKLGISPIYPFFELITGVLFAAVLWQFGVTWQSLCLLFLVANLVVITITDLKDRAIFLINSQPLIPLGLLYNFLNLNNPTLGLFTYPVGDYLIEVPNTFISALLAILVPFVFFEGANLLSRMYLGKDGFGEGDTNLMMGVGAFLGWELASIALGLGLVFQTIVAIPMLVIQWIKEKDYECLISGGVAFFFAVFPVVILYMPMDSFLREYSLWITLVCIVISLVALVIFMKTIKEKERINYLPLGPALVVGTLICLFFGPSVLTWVKHLYGQS